MRAYSLEAMNTDIINAHVAAENLPVNAIDAQRGACVEFVKLCKERHLQALAAETFLRMLHNHAWQVECKRIRETMRPEIDKMFAPVEQELASGLDCRQLLNKLMKLMSEHKMGS